MIIDYNKFIDESYLEDNFAPLYHFTSTFPLNEILDDDCLNVGYYENSYKEGKLQFVSLTRNKNLKLNFREMNIRLERDQNLLRNDFKIIPYDFYVHSKLETQPKSSIKRKQPVEYEEIILNNIKNLHKYLISINYFDFNLIFKNHKNLLLYTNNHPTIKITVQEKIINIHEI